MRRRVPLPGALHLGRPGAGRRHAALAAVSRRPREPAAGPAERAAQRLAGAVPSLAAPRPRRLARRARLLSGTRPERLRRAAAREPPVRRALARTCRSRSSPATRRPIGGSSPSSLVAQLFCLLLAAHLGLSAAAGAVVALAFGFSSFMQPWALHPHAASASFAPGILWAMLRLVRRAVGVEAPGRGRVRRALDPRGPSRDGDEVHPRRRRGRPAPRRASSARRAAGGARRGSSPGPRRGLLLSACGAPSLPRLRRNPTSAKSGPTTRWRSFPHRTS